MKIDQVVILVCTVFRNPKEEVLLLKRSSINKHYKEHWQLPEGKIDNNESPVDAMRRELREELGFITKKLDLKHVLAIPIQTGGLNIALIKLVFTSKAKPKKVNLGKEHTNHGWFPINKALDSDIALVPGTKEVLERI